MRFRGSFPVSVDDKGRIAVPSAYRDNLREHCEGKLVISPDVDRSLRLMTEPRYLEFEEQLDKLPALNPKSERLRKLFIGLAHPVKMDANGRVLIPGTLREIANIDKKGVITGMGRYMSLRPEDNWKEALDELFDQPDELTHDADPVIFQNLLN